MKVQCPSTIKSIFKTSNEHNDFASIYFVQQYVILMRNSEQINEIKIVFTAKWNVDRGGLIYHF